LRPECVERLRPLLVSVATAANPLDLTPTTAFRAESLAQLPLALDVIAAEPAIDSLIFIVGSLASRANEISDVIRGFWDRSPKPVCVSWPSPPTGSVERLAEHGIYSFLEPARGIRALAHLTRHRATASRPTRPAAAARASFDWSRFVPERGERIVVPEHRCHEILKAAGLPVAAGVLATDEAAALRAAAELAMPVALKGVGPAVTHRAAAGLLAIDLRSEADVAAGFRRIRARAAEIGAALDGIYVQKMHPGGAELLVSAFRDPLFGVMVSCGAGSGLAEIIDDVVTERAPVGRERARDMIERLRIRGQAREGGAALAPEAAAAFIADLSALAATAPWRRFVLEVNPIKWSRDGVVAVDGLLIVEES
jgi:acyl-CoA synthetase (NDP forming)